MAIAPLEINLVDIDSPPKDQKRSLYSQWCMYLLRSEFRRVSTSEIRSALKRHKGRLIPAYMAIALAQSDAMRNEQKNPLDDGKVYVGIHSSSGLAFSLTLIYFILCE